MGLERYLVTEFVEAVGDVAALDTGATSERVAFAIDLARERCSGDVFGRERESWVGEVELDVLIAR